jgi:hypothetical protein
MTAYDQDFAVECQKVRQAMPGEKTEKAIATAHRLINSDPKKVEQFFQDHRGIMTDWPRIQTDVDDDRPARDDEVEHCAHCGAAVLEGELRSSRYRRP